MGDDGEEGKTGAARRAAEGKSEGRSSKSEIRNPKSERNPKAEIRRRGFCNRISDFGFRAFFRISDFGPSDFGFAVCGCVINTNTYKWLVLAGRPLHKSRS